MALISGTKLGPYEIQSPLGAGGMGEVYRAHDARLGRDVAIKVLPQSFSSVARARSNPSAHSGIVGFALPAHVLLIQDDVLASDPQHEPVPQHD